MKENDNLSVSNTEQPVTTVEEPLQPAAPVENVTPETPVTPEAPSEPIAPVTPVEPVAPVVPEQPTSPAETVSQSTIQPIGEPVTATKKKSKLPLIIILAIVLIGAAVAVYFLFFRKVTGKEVVNGTINKLFSTAETISEKLDEAFIIDYKNDIIKSEGYLKASIETNDETIKNSLNGVNNVSLKYDYQLNAKDLEGYLNLSSNENDKEIINLTALLTNKVAYFKSNVFESTYKYDMSEDVDWNELKEIINGLPEYNSKFVSTITKKAKEYLKNSIKDEYITQEEGKYTVDGVNIEGSKTTITITEQRYYEIMKSIASQAKDDNELLELIEKSTTIPKEEIKKKLEEIIKELDKEKDFDDDKLYINIYTTSRGSFLALEVKMETTTYFTAVSQNNITTIKVNINDETIVITYDEKKKELTWNNDIFDDLPVNKVVVTLKDNGTKIELFIQEYKVILEYEFINTKTQLNEKLTASLEYTESDKKTKGSLEIVSILEKTNEIKKFDTTNAKDIKEITETEAKQITDDFEKAVNNSIIGKTIIEAFKATRRVAESTISNPYCTQAYNCTYSQNGYHQCKYSINDQEYDIIC